MRALVVLAWFVAIGSCGPSTRDVALAKTARFKADKLVLFEAAKLVTERKHKIYQSDETELTIHTRARWFTPSGLGSQWTDPGDVIAMGRGNTNPLANPGRLAIPDKSLNISMVIRLLPEANNWIVYIETKIFRFNAGMPNLEKVDPKRIDLPGWATGKANQLAYEIYRALRRYEVKGVFAAPVDHVPVPDPVDPNVEPHSVDVPGVNAGSGSDAGSGSGTP
jgi:hypothetical protein